VNGIIIEQSAEQATKAVAFHKHAELESIRLVKSRCVGASEPVASVPAILVGFNHKAKVVEAPEGTVRIEIDFRMEGFEKPVPEAQQPSAGSDEAAKPNKRVILVDCTLSAEYKLNPGYVAEPEDVKAFKDGNAVFNCWPYFREFLQNTLIRMNWPPLTAPFMRLQPKPKSAAVEGGSTAIPRVIQEAEQ
jgi:hypothetical protein